MSTKHDLSVWEGDGLPDYDDWSYFVNVLEMTTAEQQGWLEVCKREAWVREKMVKHDTDDHSREWQLAVCHYFWRRVTKLSQYIKRLMPKWISN